MFIHNYNFFYYKSLCWTFSLSYWNDFITKGHRFVVLLIMSWYITNQNPKTQTSNASFLKVSSFCQLFILFVYFSPHYPLLWRNYLKFTCLGASLGGREICRRHAGLLLVLAHNEAGPMFNSAGWRVRAAARTLRLATFWRPHLLHLAAGRYFWELVWVNPHLNFNSRGSVSRENGARGRSPRKIRWWPTNLSFAKWLLKFKVLSLIKADLAAPAEFVRHPLCNSTVLESEPLN
jgi:hypothetical protein